VIAYCNINVIKMRERKEIIRGTISNGISQTGPTQQAILEVLLDMRTILAKHATRINPVSDHDIIHIAYEG
jgi:hypothetical protein